MAFTTTSQRRLKLGEAPVSIDAVMLSIGYRVTIGWQHPLMFYPVARPNEKGELIPMSGDEIARAEKDPPIKLLQRHINEIHDRCETRDDVIQACLQVQEHGDLVSPIQGQINAAVANATRDRDDALAKMAEQIAQLQARLDAGEKPEAPKPKRAPSAPAPAA